jgi:hypothetical protein
MVLPLIVGAGSGGRTGEEPPSAVELDEKAGDPGIGSCDGSAESTVPTCATAPGGEEYGEDRGGIFATQEESQNNVCLATFRFVEAGPLSSVLRTFGWETERKRYQRRLQLRLSRSLNPSLSCPTMLSTQKASYVQLDTVQRENPNPNATRKKSWQGRFKGVT